MLASHPSPSLLASRWLSRLWRAAIGLEHSFRTLRQHVAFYCRQVRPAPEQAIPAPFEGDLLAWSKHFLPHYFQAPPSKMHREIAEILDRSSLDCCRLAPRAVAHPETNPPTSTTTTANTAQPQPSIAVSNSLGVVTSSQGDGSRSEPATEAAERIARMQAEGGSPNQQPTFPFRATNINSALPTPNSELSPHSALNAQPRGREAAAGTSIANSTAHSPADSRPLESFPVASPLASISEHQRLTSPLKLNVLAPRASAKSTLVTLSYALREAIEGRGGGRVLAFVWGWRSRRTGGRIQPPPAAALSASPRLRGSPYPQPQKPDTNRTRIGHLFGHLPASQTALILERNLTFPLFTLSVFPFFPEGVWT